MLPLLVDVSIAICRELKHINQLCDTSFGVNSEAQMNSEYLVVENTAKLPYINSSDTMKVPLVEVWITLKYMNQ